MKRQIIQIDQDKCTGCGACIPGCPEGALQVIDGKARLVSDLFCDGLGACIGECPEGAIEVIEREAAAYDEALVIAQIVPQGTNTLRAHLEHLRSHGQTAFLKTAMDYLHARGIPVPPATPHQDPGCGCQGSANQVFGDREPEAAGSGGTVPSRLTHWPVQMHLISPRAPQYAGADLLVAADCTAFAMGDFHSRLLANRRLVIACPKLDQGLEVYLEKLVALIDDALVNTITVAIMTVPCCGGLLSLVRQAQNRATRKVPVKLIVVNPEGEIVREEWT